MRVIFDQDVVVTGFSLLGLFDAEGPNGEPESGLANFGREGLNTLVFFDGTQTMGVGLKSVTGLSVTDFTDIAFTAEGSASVEGAFSDYALASITFEKSGTVVPEPNSLVLLSIVGMTCVGGRRKRTT